MYLGFLPLLTKSLAGPVNFDFRVYDRVKTSNCEKPNFAGNAKFEGPFMTAI